MERVQALKLEEARLEKANQQRLASYERERKAGQEKEANEVAYWEKELRKRADMVAQLEDTLRDLQFSINTQVSSFNYSYGLVLACAFFYLLAFLPFFFLRFHAFYAEFFVLSFYVASHQQESSSR